MEVFEVKEKVVSSGEYILGVEQTGSHACYLIYGTMGPRKKGRELKPGKGHEELFLAVKGEFVITGHASGAIAQGKAVHLKGDDTYLLENATDSEAIYVLAGGHSSGRRH